MWCSGELGQLCNVLFGVSPNKEQCTTMWQTSWIGCMTHIIMPNIWRWPVTWWRPTTTAWLIPQDSTKETKSDCIAQPRQEESQLSSSRHGKVPTRWSPGSMIQSTRFKFHNNIYHSVSKFKSLSVPYHEAVFSHVPLRFVEKFLNWNNGNLHEIHWRFFSL